MERSDTLEFGQSWAVAMTLLDGPKTLKEVSESLNNGKTASKGQESFWGKVLTGIENKGWVEECQGQYSLTATGRKEAEKANSESAWARKLTRGRIAPALNPDWGAVVGRAATYIAFMLLYVLALVVVSYIPFADLWQGTDYEIGRITFPWVNAEYSYTLMNVILFLWGFGVFIYANKQFRSIIKENQRAKDKTGGKPTTLLTTGHYGEARHPMYGMMILQYGAFCFTLKSWVPLLVALVVGIVMTANGLLEERFSLIPLFGEEYTQYSKKVKRRFFGPTPARVLLASLLLSIAGLAP